jgi:hypothetical protein
MRKVIMVKLTGLALFTLLATACNSTGRGSSSGANTGSATINQNDPIFPQSTERLNNKYPEGSDQSGTAPQR